MLEYLRLIYAAVSRFFREREIYLRSEGRVRLITLKPYMQVLLSGAACVLVTAGIVSGIGFYSSLNAVNLDRSNLKETTATLKTQLDKSLVNQKEYLTKTQKTFETRLAAKETDRKRELKELRDAYEYQLAQFQSSINLINGRLVNNQGAYLKELTRLLADYKSLQQRQIKLEDMMDQGWTPRLVSAPNQSSAADAADGDKKPVNELPPPASKTKIKPRKNSSFFPGDFHPGTSYQPIENKLASADINPTLAVSGSYKEGFAALKAAMDEHWNRQKRINAKINFSARKRVKEMVQLLSSLKFDLAKLKLDPNPVGKRNVGGPFVELKDRDFSKSSNGFNNIKFASLKPFRKIYLLEQALLELPIRRPLSDLRSITSPYGPRLDPFRNLYAMHRGVDFRAPLGEPVLATAAGVVTLAEQHSKSGYGKVIVIRHEHGITTLYGHLSKINVRVGDRIKSGDVIGEVGNTGRSTGPHLHYETRVDDSHVDPIDYLEAARYVF